ncbi:MAG TPA: hypothetical protein VF801_06255 [Rhodocyclaceae bacterium]
MAQMQTVSIRMPDEDFQWLLSLQDKGAKTPSEKLRALLTWARQQEAGMADPALCAMWMRSMVQPLVQGVAAFERGRKDHSDVVAAALEWTPQIMATLVSSRLAEGCKPADAVELEAVLGQQCFRLLIALLRAAVTSMPAVYDPGSLERHLPDVVEIAEIISNRKRKESENG